MILFHNVLECVLRAFGVAIDAVLTEVFIKANGYHREAASMKVMQHLKSVKTSMTYYSHSSIRYYSLLHITIINIIII